MSRTHRLRTILFAVLTGATTLGPALPTGSASVSLPPVLERQAQPPSVTIHAATPEQEAMAVWALGRFAEAGLELPPMTVAFHASVDGCRGFIGHYSQSAQQLDICNPGEGRTDPVHTILHELAHAWSFGFLRAEVQDQWSRHRGLDAWHDDSVAWWKQGREQAAEVVAWGLMSDSEPFVNVWVIGERCENLAASFRNLTGVDPLHTTNHSCR